MFKGNYAPLFVLLVIIGCAKEKPYDEVNKTADLEFASAHQPKDLILDMCTVEDPCLYVPSVLNTPYEVTASRPFWQGETKLVVTDVTSDKIRFLEVEKDKRFQDNINNFSPVFNIGVEHVDYKCTEDEFGDCTNNEEVDSDKSWSDKRFVKMQKFQIVEANSLPIQMSELFSAGCFSEIDTNVSQLDVDKSSMNVIVKRTYKMAGSCATSIESYDDLRYMTFTVDYAYSVFKLSSIADKNYVPVDYPAADQNEFGFFTTEQKTKTVDNHDHVMGIRKDLLNRWSPNKKTITYNLNSEFYVKGNEKILEATYNSIASINDSLNEAGAGIQIKLQKGDDAKLGDMRENFIVLVKDPQASGVIGYGPSVKNPLTGEILSARTIMYYGTIQKFVSTTWDDLIDEVVQKRILAQQQQQQNEPAQEKSAPAAPLALSKVTNAKFLKHIMKTRGEKALARFQNNNQNTVTLGTPLQNIMSDMNEESEKQLKLVKESVQSVLNGGMSAKEKFLAKLSNDTFYHSDFVNYDANVIEMIEDELDAGTLRMWDDLTEAKRKQIMAKLLPFTWISTLVHEFGHNLGLRHNFRGNIDTKNYYSKEELAKKGVARAATFSSIMDYAPRSVNELYVMGKYDVAALRFAYARKIEVQADGQTEIVSMDNLLNESNEMISLKDFKKMEKNKDLILKSYMYCTDEHVSSDLLCNRHDEGHNYETVAKYYIDQFNDNYEKVNFRRRKYDFNSSTGDMAYLSRVFGTFYNVRRFFDSYDQLVSNGSYDSPSDASKPFLLDIKKAADLSFKFFKEQLEAPAYHCIEYTKNGITRVLPFTEMAKGTKLAEYGIKFDIRYGCFYLNNLGREGHSYAEFGQYFNNSIDIGYDTSERLDYASQIDIRGTWLNKALATLILSARFTAPTTYGLSSAGNYFDYPEYRESIMSTFNSILDNNIVKNVEVRLPNGQAQTLAVKYGFESSQMVNMSYNYGVNFIMNLKSSQTNIKKVIASVFKAHAMTAERGSVDEVKQIELYDTFNVKAVPLRSNLSDYNYDKQVVFKDENGKDSFKFGVYSYNTLAMKIAEQKEILDVFYSYPKVYQDIALMMVVNGLELEFVQTDPNSPAEMVSALEEIFGLVGKDYMKKIISGEVSYDVFKSSFLALATPAGLRLL